MTFPDKPSWCYSRVEIDWLKKRDKHGKEQYQKYVTDATKDRSRSIYNPIKQNNLPLFCKNYKKEDSKQGKNIAVLQSNSNLVAHLCVALQSRDGDMREFFSHEVQSFPPVLSEFVPSAKSDLLKCLQPTE